MEPKRLQPSVSDDPEDPSSSMTSFTPQPPNDRAKNDDANRNKTDGADAKRGTKPWNLPFTPKQWVIWRKLLRDIAQIKKPSRSSIMKVIAQSKMWDFNQENLSELKRHVLPVFSVNRLPLLHKQAEESGIHFDEKQKEEDNRLMTAVSASESLAIRKPHVLTLSHSYISTYKGERSTRRLPHKRVRFEWRKRRQR
jgi:hypothetical protein